MSPTYTMSAHLCKQIYSSWRQTKQDPSPLPSPPTTFSNTTSYFPRPSSPTEKHSMDSDRGEHVPLTRQTSASSWRWGSR